MTKIIKISFKNINIIKAKPTKKGLEKMAEVYTRISRFGPTKVKVADVDDFYSFTFTEFADFFGGLDLEIGNTESQLYTEAFFHFDKTS